MSHYILRVIKELIKSEDKKNFWLLRAFFLLILEGPSTAFNPNILSPYWSEFSLKIHIIVLEKNMTIS
jgi:hypothetical protein